MILPFGLSASGGTGGGLGPPEIVSDPVLVGRLPAPLPAPPGLVPDVEAPVVRHELHVENGVSSRRRAVGAQEAPEVDRVCDNQPRRAFMSDSPHLRPRRAAEGGGGRLRGEMDFQ